MSTTGVGRRWMPGDLESTGAHLVRVTAPQVERLAQELPTEFATPRTEDDAEEYRDRATKLLGDLAAEIHHRTQSGPGFAIVHGDGLDKLTDTQLAAMLYGISLVLGRPMAQNPAGDRIVSVRDEGTTDPNARGYRTNKALLMHTDAADVLGLICLAQGASGGRNVFASAETVHDVICDERPDLIHEYYRIWEWDRRGLEPKGERPTLSSPIFSYYAGRLSCRYASLLLRNGAARLGQTLTETQLAALDLFDDVAQRPDLQLSYRLSRGESMWLNNYAVLHGRQEFTDGSQPTQVRHLLRTWVWLHDGPRLAAHFASPREVY